VAAVVNEYEVGSLVRVTASFLVGATPTDPTTVTVKVKDPLGGCDDGDADERLDGRLPLRRRGQPRRRLALPLRRSARA
jgi:hypothetical protein